MKSEKVKSDPRFFAIILWLALSWSWSLKAETPSLPNSPILDFGHAIVLESNADIEEPWGTLKMENGTLVPLTIDNSRTAGFLFNGTGLISLSPVSVKNKCQMHHLLGMESLFVPIHHALLITNDEEILLRLMQSAKTHTITEKERHDLGKFFNLLLRSEEIRIMKPFLRLHAYTMSGDRHPRLISLFTRTVLTGTLFVDYDTFRHQGEVLAGHYSRMTLTPKERRELKRIQKRLNRKYPLFNTTSLPPGYLDIYMTQKVMTDSPPPFPYSMKMILDITRPTKTIHGEAHIVLDKIVPLMMLSLSPLFKVTSIHDSEGKDLPYISRDGLTFIIIPTDITSSTSLDISYEGRLFEKGSGGTLRLLDTTGWYPSLLNGKSRETKITFHHPHSLHLVTCGQLDSQHKAGKIIEETYVYSNSISPIFSLGKYKMVTLKTLNTSIVFYLMNINKKKAIDLTNRITNILLLYNDYFGSFRCKNLKIVEVDHLDSYEGLSQEGIIFISQEYLSGRNDFIALLNWLLDPTSTLDFVLSHEMLHQYWGVGMAVRDEDKWIYEGLAQYMAAKYVASFEGINSYNRILSSWNDHLYQDYSLLPSPWESGTLSMGSFLDTSIDPNLSTLLLYTKSPIIFAVIDSIIGKNSFRPFIHKLAADYPNGAKTEDIITLVNKFTNKNYSILINSLINDTQRIVFQYDVNIDNNEDNNKAMVTLTYLSDTTYPDLYVPFTIYLKKDRDKQVRSVYNARMITKKKNNHFHVTLNEPIDKVVFNAGNILPFTILADAETNQTGAIKRAIYWIQRGDQERAIRVLQDFIDAAGRSKVSATMWRIYALLLHRRGETKKVLQIPSGDPTVLALKALIHQNEGKWDRAHSGGKDILKKHENNPLAHMEEGLYYAHLGDEKRAIKEIRAALDNNSVYYELEHAAALIYRRFDRRTQSMTHLRTAVRLGYPLEKAYQEGLVH